MKKRGETVIIIDYIFPKLTTNWGKCGTPTILHVTSQRRLDTFLELLSVEQLSDDFPQIIHRQTSSLAEFHVKIRGGLSLRVTEQKRHFR